MLREQLPEADARDANGHHLPGGELREHRRVVIRRDVELDIRAVAYDRGVHGREAIVAWKALVELRYGFRADHPDPEPLDDLGRDPPTVQPEVNDGAARRQQAGDE